MEETDRARFSVKTRESVISWITSLLDPRREGSTRIMNSMHQQRYTAVLRWKVKISDVIIIEGGHTAPWKFVNGHARATPWANHWRDKKVKKKFIFCPVHGRPRLLPGHAHSRIFTELSDLPQWWKHQISNPFISVQLYSVVKASSSWS